MAHDIPTFSQEFEQRSQEITTLSENLKNKTITLAEYTQQRINLFTKFNTLRNEIISFESTQYASLNDNDKQLFTQIVQQMTDLGNLLSTSLPKPETLKKATYAIKGVSSRAWFTNENLSANDLGSLEGIRYFGNNISEGADYFLVKIGGKNYVLRIVSNPNIERFSNIPQIVEIDDDIENDKSILAQITYKPFYNIKIKDSAWYTHYPFVTNTHLESTNTMKVLENLKTFTK